MTKQKLYKNKKTSARRPETPLLAGERLPGTVTGLAHGAEASAALQAAAAPAGFSADSGQRRQARRRSRLRLPSPWRGIMKAYRSKWLIMLLLLVTVITPSILPAAAFAGAADKATGSAAGAAGLPFNDTGALTSVQQASIARALEAGLLHGDPSGRFRPHDLLTRQETAVLLAEALELPLGEAATAFKDVGPHAWSGRYIEAVRNAGLMIGDSNGTFRPAASISRQELAVLLMRAARIPLEADASGASKLLDWKRVGSWAKPYVNTAILAGAMQTAQSKFDPSGQVQRQDIAEMLLETFFPTDRPSYLQSVADGRIRVNGVAYALSDAVKGLLQPGNKAVLQDATIEFAASGRTVQSVTRLELRASGQAPAGAAAEFSGDLVLDGHGTALDGDLIVSSDYITVKNLRIGHDFTITSKLEHDLLAQHVQVDGATLIQGGDLDTVQFEDSELETVDVTKQDVHVVATGGSSVQQLTVSSDASIENRSSSTMKQVTIESGAQQVNLDGSFQQVAVNGSQPTTVTGNAVIAGMTVNSSSSVNLSGTGTITSLQVNNASAAVNVGAAQTVGTVTVADNVPPTTVTKTSTPPVNTAPVLTTKYSDAAFTVGDADLRIALLGHFSDSEQSALKYSVTSSNAAISTARIDGEMIVLKAVGKGTATISILADDQAGKKAGTTFKVTVNAPPVSNGISDQSVVFGTGTLTLALNGLFSDADRDRLTYTAELADASLTTFALTGDQFTITPAQIGHTTVTVQASDGRGGTNSQTFQLTVTNQDPVVSQQPENRTLTIGADDTLDLSGTFNDPNHDPLTYEASSSDASIAAVAVNGTQAVIHAAASGTATIQLKAKDSHDGEASASFTVTANESPTSIGIADQTKVVNTGDVSLSLNSFFSDYEQDALTYAVTVASPSVASYRLTGDQLALTPIDVGGTDVTVEAADGRGGTNSQTFRLTVTNLEPVVSQQPNAITVTIGGGDDMLDLSLTFSDPNGESLTYEASSSDTSVATIAVVGNQAVIHAVSSGTATIELKAQDPHNGEASASFALTVNEPPASSGIADQTKLVNTGDVSLSLNDLFSDYEHDALTYSITIADPSIASYSLIGDRLALTPINVGGTDVTVEAADGRGGTSSQTFRLTVTNLDPIVGQQPGDRTMTTGGADDTLDLSQAFSDPNGDSLTYEASSSDPAVAAVSVSGSQATVHALASGTATILLTAKDSHDGEVSASFALTVNEPPVSGGIPNQTKELGSGAIELALNDLFTDTEHDALTYTATVANTSVAASALTGGRLTLTPAQAGSTNVTVTASDGRGGTNSQTFLLTVTLPNHNPVGIQQPDKTLSIGGHDLTLDLAAIFSDPDSDPLTFEAEAEEPAVATVTVTGTQAVVHAVALGATTIHLTAKDNRGGTGTVSFKANVTDAPENAPPAAVAMIYEQVLTPGVTNSRSYDLSQLFEDPDADTLTFTAVALVPGIVNADVSGSIVTFTPGATTGSTTITLTADDGRGGTAHYDLVVRNAPLAANGRLQIHTKQGAAGGVTVDLTTVFPNDTSFKVYTGTADSTFMGPTPLNGTTWTWDNQPYMMYWIIAADGTAAVISVTADAQGAADLYFSQYVSMDQTRNVLQLFYNEVGDLSRPITEGSYSLEIHQYNTSTGEHNVSSQRIYEFWKGQSYIYIDPRFEDYMDLTDAAYYNDELALLQTSTNFTTGFVLKKGSTVVDVLGNPDGTAQFMPNGGTIIRKSGIRTGSSAFDLYGEWNEFPRGTLQFVGHHTP